MCNGPSSWNFSRYASTIGPMSPPEFPAWASRAMALASMGSPGARRVSRKTAVTPTATVNTKSPSLRTKYAGFMLRLLVVVVEVTIGRQPSCSLDYSKTLTLT